MIHSGFLDVEPRQDLIELAQDGLVEHCLARRANALLLDDGMSCEAGLRTPIGARAGHRHQHRCCSTAAVAPPASQSDG